MRPDIVVRYADHPDGTIDLHLPESGSGPLVVILHGGFWRSEWDRRHTRPQADALRREGYVVATPEYRRTGAGGGWPWTFDDVGHAVGDLPVLLGDLGIPVTTTTLLGHSAGGHLALWLASEGLPLDRVVALAPVGDLRDAYRRNLDGGAVRDLVGEPFDAADPAVRLRHDPGVPVVVLHGSEDAQVPVENTLGWAADNPHVDLRVIEGAEHFGFIEPTSQTWRYVLQALQTD
ncbi:MAG TPA: alpha/beta hydrolase [Nocardioidaceae bacterium]|nr:alpha/beta hydrolase [Nocardioidaceae bacterium]